MKSFQEKKDINTRGMLKWFEQDIDEFSVIGYPSFGIVFMVCEQLITSQDLDQLQNFINKKRKEYDVLPGSDRHNY